MNITMLSWILTVLGSMILGYIVAEVMIWLYKRRIKKKLMEATNDIAQPIQNWKLYPYGGGQAIPFQCFRKETAIDYCARHYGNVMHIDEENCFIFYKPFGYQPGS